MKKRLDPKIAKWMLQADERLKALEDAHGVFNVSYLDGEKVRQVGLELKPTSVKATDLTKFGHKLGRKKS